MKSKHDLFISPARPYNLGVWNTSKNVMKIGDLLRYISKVKYYLLIVESGQKELISQQIHKNNLSVQSLCL